MPIWNSGKLFQVRSKTEKSKFIGKGYSTIGPAKRAISTNHNWALKRAADVRRFADSERHLSQHHLDALKSPWLDPTNFEIVEYAVVEKAVHEYTPT